MLATVILLAATTGLAPVTASLPSGDRVVWRRGEAPALLALPRPGEGWLALAVRVSGDIKVAATLREANGRQANPLRDVRVMVPWPILRRDLRPGVVQALFPADRRVDLGWEHEIKAPWGGDGESWWELAEWFCGDGSLYPRLRDASPSAGMFPVRGARILIPEDALLPEFRAIAVKPHDGQNGRRRVVPATGANVAPTAPVPTAPAPLSAPPTSAGARSYSPTVLGTPGRSAPLVGRTAPSAGFDDAHGELSYSGAEAIYRLKPGEALYSAVVVRFTGQLHAADVNETAAEIAGCSGISDVTDIAIGYPVRIPFDLLLPEFLPHGHPRRQAWERDREELAAIRRAIRVANLDGIHVILDAGHGGRDSGAVGGNVWESTYVYDVMTRVKRVIERETRATVWTTVRDDVLGDRPPDLDVLPQQRGQRLLVTPPYPLDDPATGVHLRWVLTDSLLAGLRRQKIAAERVAFVSIHADSLHPAVRGLMVYVPGRALRSSRAPVGRVEWPCREVSKLATPRFSARFNSRSEALSSQLGDAVVRAAGRASIPVHPYQPVRSSVLRGGSRWVPAVLKYSQVPTSVLIEICNLNNEEDRALLLSWKSRDRLAHALVAGIAEAFAQ